MTTNNHNDTHSECVTDLVLTRRPAVGKAVYGILTISGATGMPVVEVSTLENLDYLIPSTSDNAYTVVQTFSPRFQRALPLVCGVPGRSGIRFHTGSRPEHSQGCILLSAGNLNLLIACLTQSRKCVLKIR